METSHISHSSTGNLAPLVDKVVGSAYDVVREVAYNLEYIKHVSAHLESIYRVYSSIDSLDIIADNIDDLEALLIHINEVLIVAENINSVVAVANDIEAVSALNAEIVKLRAIYAELDSIVIVANEITAVAATGHNIESVVIVAANIDELLGIYSNLAAILNLNPDFATRAALVTYVASNAATVQGRTYNAGGRQYVCLPGSTAIPDLPGIIPFGVATPQHFGARGDGVTNDTVAFIAAWAYGISLSKPVFYVPAGYYILSSLATSFNVVSNMEIYGDGMESTTIKWIDSTTNTTYLIGSPTLQPRLNNITMRDIHIRGNHDSNYVQDNHHLLVFYNVDGLRFERVKTTYSRCFCIVGRGCFDVTVNDCIVMYSARDGINTADCSFVRITNNTIAFTDDDSIACHTVATGTADRGVVISGNVIRFCQGIKILGGTSVAITGNLIEYCMGQGISVMSTNTGTGEGVTAEMGITITGNTIKNCIDRTIVDALNGTAHYILIGGAVAQAGGLAAIPGEPNPATGTVISPYPYFVNSKNNITTAPIPSNYSIVVSGNTLVRDCPESGLISALGYGMFYVRSGPKDCTLTTAAVRQAGMLITGGITKNVSITGNVFMGLNYGVYTGYLSTKMINCIISDNVFYDIAVAGFVAGANTANHQGIIFSNNIFDLDPFFLNANRGPNGTWLTNNHPTSITIGNSFGYVIQGNTFRNCARAVDHNISDFAITNGARYFARGNIIDCEPASVSFSTTNKGVGYLSRGGDSFTVRVVDSNPASPTYGNVLNNCPIESNGMPTSGSYLSGHYVRNSAPAVAGVAPNQYLVHGWVRLKTSAAHVLNTDWAEVRTLTGT